MTRALCAVLLATVLATAQSGKEELLTVEVDLVNIHFTVSNHKGKPVADLDRTSFSVFEDDNAQVITHFSREADVPLNIVLLIDTSGSVRYKLSFEQEAAIGFLHTLRRDRDRAAIVTFDSVELQQDYTDDAGLLAEAVRRTRAGGGTRLYDALYFVLKEKLAGDEDRKSIVLITDGDDNSSTITPQEVIELAQRNNVAIYAISMNSVGTRLGETNRSDRVLETLAPETGGKAFFPTKLAKLPADFERIRSELRSQYSLAYRSTNPQRDGTFRRIRIEVKNIRYSVRVRSGYFAPHEVTAQRNSSAAASPR